MPGQYFGKYTGIVKDNRDDEGLGQVKVSVPAIFPPDELMTARPALPYGYFFVPENEAKVWVEFEGGDPGLVLWTGVQYVPGEWPAEARANPPRRRVVRSAAGHALLFEDAEGAEKVQITEGAHAHDVTFDASGITLRDGVNGHSITLDAGGIRLRTAGGAEVALTASGIVVDAGPGIAEMKGSLVKLGPGAAPVIRVGDSGIGNLGAPVVMSVTTNSQVLA
ncbi:phage baseplate assembly protein V [Actinomadura macra]|uniref:phage baseplate assembly protein V n=1 Tax=Actinomadura macra TaxID=46164 RepID=UPI00082C9118|nr:phage baseplate assembly protein V [Actinomadura macra]